MAFVHAVLHACAAGGVDTATVLAQAQIAPQHTEDAKARITSAQMEALCEAAMRALDDEALGWFERRLPWGSYGLLARASLGAPTLGRALTRWCRHHGLLTDTVALTLAQDAQGAHITLTERRPIAGGDARLREFCSISLLRNLHGMACWLIDSRLPLLGADFAYPAPAHADVYPLLFPGPVRFGAAQTALHLDARYLALPLARGEAQLQRLLARALPLMVRPYRRDRLLVERVRQLLAGDAATLQGAQALAERLHLSVRTLHRQLKEEGASLQALKDEARRARAEQLLRQSTRPIKQVALAAGFTNEKSFIRAFRGWTGEAPGEWRRSETTSRPATL